MPVLTNRIQQRRHCVGFEARSEIAWNWRLVLRCSLWAKPDTGSEVQLRCICLADAPGNSLGEPSPDVQCPLPAIWVSHLGHPALRWQQRQQIDHLKKGSDIRVFSNMLWPLLYKMPGGIYQRAEIFFNLRNYSFEDQYNYNIDIVDVYKSNIFSS